MEEQSFALDLLRDYKKQNKRQFIVILVILTMWFASIGLFIYYINTTGYEEITETAETPQQKQMLREALQSSMM